MYAELSAETEFKAVEDENGLREGKAPDVPGLYGLEGPSSEVMWIVPVQPSYLLALN
jgi:hypothetical protein